MRIALESPDQPDVIALIAELDAYRDSLYPPESRHALDLGVLGPVNTTGVGREDPLAGAIKAQRAARIDMRASGATPSGSCQRVFPSG